MRYHLFAITLLFLLAACTAPASPAQPTQEVALEDGAVFQLDAHEVTKSIAGTEQRMYAYNGQLPGPRLRVKQGSTVYVNFTNNLPEDTTIHWHGLRHDYKHDGVPGISQEPVRPGESFTYTLEFRDSGIFWYHPHIRDDRQQDLGLYANIIVDPADRDEPAPYELFLIVDDMLIEDGKNVEYGKDTANFALMGRYGNTMLVNGEASPAFTVEQGERIRLHLTAVANARPFNISIERTRMKLIGSDFGSYERETMVDSIILGTAERATAEVVFTEPGEYKVRNVNMWDGYDLATITVLPSDREPEILQPKANAAAIEDIAKYKQYLDKPVDEEIILGIEFHHEADEMRSITNIEWEDTMIDENRETDAHELTWFIQDKGTGRRNSDLTYQFETGSVKRLRFINDADSPHPMQHYIHLHGQRFLILEQDGVKNDNLVWKDTFLIPAGSTIDILVDNSNPGEWMMHCHISEHIEAGMMSSFIVSGEFQESGHK